MYSPVYQIWINLQLKVVPVLLFTKLYGVF